MFHLSINNSQLTLNRVENDEAVICICEVTPDWEEPIIVIMNNGIHSHAQVLIDGKCDIPKILLGGALQINCYQVGKQYTNIAKVDTAHTYSNKEVEPLSSQFEYFARNAANKINNIYKNLKKEENE